MAASTDTAQKERELVITRVFDAPRTLVFKMWIEPEHMVRWWGPRGFTLPSWKMDFRPGGAFRLVMRGPDDTDRRLRGVYREIVEPERLTFTFAWEDEQGQLGHETLVTITFAEDSAKTKLTLHQAVFDSVDQCGKHREGWTQMLDRLALYLPRV